MVQGGRKKKVTVAFMKKVIPLILVIHVNVFTEYLLTIVGTLVLNISVCVPAH